VLPFTVPLHSGTPLYEQVIYAVTKAIVSGQLRAGDPFPSVRTLSQELRINPNTAYRIVAALVDEGLLVVHPGVGTVVAVHPPPSGAPVHVLGEDAERLVIEARRSGVSLKSLVSAIRRHWAETAARGKEVRDVSRD
jgi:DNA-binding transcriptional regulator YhcF (GntR family)